MTDFIRSYNSKFQNLTYSINAQKHCLCYYIQINEKIVLVIHFIFMNK